MFKPSSVWLALVVFLASVSSVRGEIMYQFDAPFVYATPGQTVSIAVYLAADGGSTVLAGTPDYDFLTNYGLSSAGVNIDYVLPVPSNPPYIASDSDVQANPDFVADYGSFGGFAIVEPDPFVSGPPTRLWEFVDFGRGFGDGFGVRLGEAEEVIPGVYRVLLGTFTFTVPANTEPFGITTIQASDFSPFFGDTVATDGTVLDDFITSAQMNIITPEPASCLVWTGLAVFSVVAGGIRARRRIG